MESWGKSLYAVRVTSDLDDPRILPGLKAASQAHMAESMRRLQYHAILLQDLPLNSSQFRGAITAAAEKQARSKPREAAKVSPPW